MFGGSGEIHSGHPCPSPFGQLRCAHRQSCRCVELSESVHPPLPPDTQKPPFGGPCVSGGSGEIRTHGGLTPTAVFKTAALNHSATLPYFLNGSRKKSCHPESRRHRVKNLFFLVEKHNNKSLAFGSGWQWKCSMLFEPLPPAHHHHAGSAILTCFTGAMPPGQCKQLRREASSSGGRFSAR